MQTEASGGELNSNSPPKVDVDNLEANLFSSLGKKKATTRGRRDSGETSSSPGKSVTKETPAGKKSKGFDMGELSKLLGTEDIMKDLSSAKEKPSGVSSLSGGGVKPLRPSDARIKEGKQAIYSLCLYVSKKGFFTTYNDEIIKVEKSLIYL